METSQMELSTTKKFLLAELKSLIWSLISSRTLIRYTGLTDKTTTLLFLTSSMLLPLPAKVSVPNFSFMNSNLGVDGLLEHIVSKDETYLLMSPPIKASDIFPLPMKPIISSILALSSFCLKFISILTSGLARGLSNTYGVITWAVSIFSARELLKVMMSLESSILSSLMF